MTIPVGAAPASSGVKATWTRTACTLAAVTEPLRCYRHPDRETYVSCTECGRGICPDCMTFGPVGIRCPDHASTGGRPVAPKRAARRASRTLELRGPYVTQALIAINVGIYVLQLAMGAGMNANTGWIYEHGVLVARALDTSGQLMASARASGGG